MKKLIKILFILVVFTSCEDKIELDVPIGPTKIVVDGSISNLDDIQRIRLTTTAPYFDAAPTPALSGADVIVTTNKKDTIHFIENVPKSGNYDATYKIEDTTLIYTLHITTPAGNKFQSYQEVLNRVTPIDTLYQSEERKKARGPEEDEVGYFALMSLKELKGLGDYYRWITFINGIQSTDPFDLRISDDRLVDGNEIIDWDIVYQLFPGDTLEIHQMSISQREFSYWSLVFTQITNFGGPFDTPPAPIKGNIFNVNDPNETVLGYFGVNNVRTASIIIVEK